jgi:hypothetical protein
MRDADALERPLTDVEDRLVFQVADAIEAALGGRDPALMAELAAHLMASVMFDYAVQVKGDLEACEAMAFDLMGHVMTRVNVLGMQANEALIATAVPAGHA